MKSFLHCSPFWDTAGREFKPIAVGTDSHGPTDGKAALVCVSLGSVRQDSLKASGRPLAKTPTHSQYQIFLFTGSKPAEMLVMNSGAGAGVRIRQSPGRSSPWVQALTIPVGFSCRPSTRDGNGHTGSESSQNKREVFWGPLLHSLSLKIQSKPGSSATEIAQCGICASTFSRGRWKSHFKSLHF